MAEKALLRIGGRRGDHLGHDGAVSVVETATDISRQSRSENGKLDLLWHFRLSGPLPTEDQIHLTTKRTKPAAAG